MRLANFLPPRPSPLLCLLIAMCALAGVVPCRGADEPTRANVLLNGPWECADVASGKDQVPADGWKPVTVPGIVWTAEGQLTTLWFRRDVDVPKDWDGRRIYVDVRGARYAPTLYIDGQAVSRQNDGWSPYRTEVTGLMAPGTHHTIIVRCSDQSAAYPHGWPKHDEPQRQQIFPVGGFRNNDGIADDVWLRSVPVEHIDEDKLVIVPSVRKHQLTVSGAVDLKQDPGPFWLSGQVLDGGRPVLALPARAVDGAGAWTSSAPFPHAHFWSPEDPHLYQLKLTLSRSADGPAVDTFVQRFGFKEIWTEGPDFYLNGIKRHMLGSATWPNAAPEDFSIIRDRMMKIRQSNTIIFRLHNSIWREAWLDAADEIGVLIIDESPLNGAQDADTKNPLLWENMRDVVARMIQRDRNHACLAMWSMENEAIFDGGLNYNPDLPHALAELGRYAKTVDPYHPITVEADQDPEGAYDIIGLHYPHEPPWEFAYPNTADWLGSRTTTQAPGGLLGSRSTSFFWDRKKPLYIGEYLWMPQHDYSVPSIYYGDDSYLNRDDYWEKTQARSFFDQTIAYRRSGVSGTGPWTTFTFGATADVNSYQYKANLRFYKPVTAVLQNRGLRFFAGQVAKFNFDVFDDDGKGHAFTLRLTDADHQTVGESRFTLASADYRLASFNVPMPIVTAQKNVEYTAVLLADGKPVDRSTIVCKVYPKVKLAAPNGATVTVFDPTGAWPGSVPSLSGLGKLNPKHTILVVAPNALSGETAATDLPIVGRDWSIGRAVHDFVLNGGRAVVLEQQTLTPLCLDLQLVEHASTMTFPLNRTHPILSGVAAADLSYWNDDNYVSHWEVKRPAGGGFRAVTVSGGPYALDQSPIVEGRIGAGRIVVSEALIGGKYGKEPVARRLLQNIVNYLAAGASASESRRPAVAVSSDPQFERRLTGIGVELGAASDIGSARTLLLDGGGDNVLAAAKSIDRILANGGAVYWHRPAAAAFAALKARIGAGTLSMVDTVQGPSLAAREAGLLRGVSREDLNYSVTDIGSWDRTFDPLSRGASRMFVPTNETSAARTWAPSDLTSDAKQIVHEANGTAAKFDGGSIKLPADVAQPGFYMLTIGAAGTSSDKSYPMLGVDVDGVYSSWLSLASTDRREYTTVVQLPKGKSEIQISILNGGGRPTTFYGIALSSRLDYGGKFVLARPASLIAWRLHGGLVVLDGIDWLNDPNNVLRGSRYANALLANLGVSFKMPSTGATADNLPPSDLKLIGESPYSDFHPDEILLRSTGEVGCDFYCQTAGTYRVAVDGHSTVL